MDDRTWLQIWLEIECVGVNGTRLYPIPGSTCDDVECFLDATFADGTTQHYESGQPSTGIETRRERTYCFEHPPTIPCPDVRFLGDTPDTFDTFAVIVDGQIAARAWSVRRTAKIAEIAVETNEQFRRRGYGKQVVAAWATYQLQQGKYPIYSHRIGNLESQALAESVGARQFVDVVSYY